MTAVDPPLAMSLDGPRTVGLAVFAVGALAASSALLMAQPGLFVAMLVAPVVGCLHVVLLTLPALWVALRYASSELPVDDTLEAVRRGLHAGATFVLACLPIVLFLASGSPGTWKGLALWLAVNKAALGVSVVVAARALGPAGSDERRVGWLWAVLAWSVAWPAAWDAYDAAGGASW